MRSPSAVREWAAAKAFCICAPTMGRPALSIRNVNIFGCVICALAARRRSVVNIRAPIEVRVTLRATGCVLLIVTPLVSSCRRRSARAIGAAPIFAAAVFSLVTAMCGAGAAIGVIDGSPKRLNCARVFTSIGSRSGPACANSCLASSAARPNEAPARTRRRKYWQSKSALPFPSAGPYAIVLLPKYP